MIELLREKLIDEAVDLETDVETIRVYPESDICIFESYRDLCQEWLNTDLAPDEAGYRDHTDPIQRREDKKEYFNPEYNVWFVVY